MTRFLDDELGFVVLVEFRLHVLELILRHPEWGDNYPYVAEFI